MRHVHNAVVVTAVLASGLAMAQDQVEISPDGRASVWGAPAPSDEGSVLLGSGVPFLNAPDMTLELRRQGFEKGSSFSHWPHEANVSADKPGVGYAPIELTEEQRALL